ncbi:hypothetical protein F383_34343 [Gossypium arboreum]|uniref:Uncharacterized protein n=1 Tax=Gossypium arboreum TaxID=29729 RepID=A0A0B0MYN5_GOSAR|nr:hypothetical protein F383_34343 [Gossypium arboreum]
MQIPLKEKCWKTIGPSALVGPIPFKASYTSSAVKVDNKAIFIFGEIFFLILVWR